MTHPEDRPRGTDRPVGLWRGRPGLARPSWVMTEQVRTVPRDRIDRVVGLVDGATLRDVEVYLRDFFGP